MSQHPTTTTNGSGKNTSETSGLNATAIIDLDDGEDDDVQIVETSSTSNIIDTIDLCGETPSTSAAAAAAAAANIESNKTANKENNAEEGAAAGASATSGGETSSSAILDCPICLQSCIHPARLPCGHIFCFLCVKGVAYKNRRCAMCRREIPAEFLDHPQLVNGIDDICATRATEDGYQWYYEGRNGGWWAYDERSNDEIETGYKVYEEYKQTQPSEQQQQHQQQQLSPPVPELLSPSNSVLIPIVEIRPSPPNPVEIDLRRGWWQYDDRTSQDLEEAFKKGEKSCTILVAGYVYIVDLEALVQQRQNEPTRCRRVKRDLATIPKKGVAGLRIEGNIVTTDTPSHFAQPQEQQQQPQHHQLLHHQQHHYPHHRLASTSPATTSLISTLVATDAAIRIASDIIGSSLAHADELTRGLAASNISDSAGDLSGEHAINSSHTTTIHNSLVGGGGAGVGVNGGGASIIGSGGRSLASSHSSSMHDLMRSATEDLLDSTQQVIETNQHTIDLFEQALNDFQALTLRNFGDSSDDDDDDVDDEHDNDDDNNDHREHRGETSIRRCD